MRRLAAALTAISMGCATTAPGEQKWAQGTLDACKDVQLQLYDLLHSNEPCEGRMAPISHLSVAMGLTCGKNATAAQDQLSREARNVIRNCQDVADGRIIATTSRETATSAEDCLDTLKVYRGKLLAASTTCNIKTFDDLSVAAGRVCTSAFLKETGGESAVATALSQFDVDVLNAQRRCLAKK